jgi:hypothetical protein
MITAKLIKELEKEGFKLDFPSYDSNNERIIEILKENNTRLNLALPLFLEYGFDYEKIIKKLKEKTSINEFNKIILITNKIFITEKIENTHLKEIIKKNNIKDKLSKSEFQYLYDSFKEFKRNKGEEKEEIFKENIKIRAKLNTNKALANIFSPGKRIIMGKIFQHEPLSNTELKYYYRSIRPLILSILNENLQKYIRIIESNKKYK